MNLATLFEVTHPDKDPRASVLLWRYEIEEYFAASPWIAPLLLAEGFDKLEFRSEYFSVLVTVVN